MLALHGPEAVFSLRHAPSWLLLTFAAGATNAIAFLACSRFVTHVTGTVTSIGLGVGSVTLALDYALVLACFIAGAVTSAVLVDGRYYQKKRPLYAVPLVAVSILLAAVGLLGHAGVFGAFGGTVDGPRNFAFLSILAFAMGMQNAAVATSTGLVVRTTHMTGPATDLGVHIATAMYTDGAQRRTALRHAALRSGKITSFALGGAVGAVLAFELEFSALVIPAVVVLGATALSFVSAPVSHRAEEAHSS